MEHDIVYHHKQLQENIHIVEQDESNEEALCLVKENFLAVFEMIKMVMISKQDRYYGLFLMNFELRIDFSSYHDAGVNLDAYPFRMIVNPLLIGLKPLPEMIYIFCHEIEHIVLNHPTDGIKYNPQKDPGIGYKLNVAMDASINDRLTYDSMENKSSVIAEPAEAITSTYLREAYRLHIKPLQSFDYYFERIPDGGFGGGVPTEIVFVWSGERNEIITEPKRKGMIYLPCWTENDDPDEIESIIRKFVSDVCDEMPETMRENLPQHQQDALQKLLTPPTITWKQLLKRYIGTIPDGRRKTRTRLSRRQPERFDISGTIQSRIIKLIVAIDTSGSMETETLERIMVEIFDIVGTRMCDVTIIECDAQIQRIYKARSCKDISYELQGRGGTLFTPVIEHINQNRQYRDAILIYFTDGEGDRSIPRPLTFRNIWVLHNDQCTLSVRNPYGEVLVMD